MKTVLDLKNLTRLEKLRVMEELWADLSRDDDAFESSEWHRDILEQREKDIQEGKDEFVPLEEVRRILRDARE